MSYDRVLYNDVTEKQSKDDCIIPTTKRKRNRRRFERERYFTTAVDPRDLGIFTNNMTTTTSSATPPVGGNKLVQEINEEFLTCKICLEIYKSPKCLDCLHTFCEQCIDNHVMTECTYKKYSDYREFTCPLCRKRTQLPLGGVKKLPDNFLVSGLSEMVGRQKPSKFPFCDICKLVNHKHREASSKCIDCNKLLCKQCVDQHRETKVTKGHNLFDVEIEKDIECKEHSDEVVRFYCEPCESCICVLCTFNEHKDHEITQFADAVAKYKENIQNLLDSCKDRISVFDDQLTTLGKCDEFIKTAEQKVRDVAIQFIADIRSKEKQLLEEIHQMYGDELMTYISRKKEMQVNLESLKSTCNLTELVLKGKDIELLLLKKQVQEKLSHLADVKLKPLPDSVSKQLAFLPGSLKLGELTDLGQPGNSNKGKHTTYVDPHRSEAHAQAQTDLKMWEVAIRRPVAHNSVQTDDGKGCGGSNHFTHDDKSTNTEVVTTEEKAVNTRSRSLQSLTNQLKRTESKEGSPIEQPSNAPEPMSSPTVARRDRHRRRRNRQPMEVSVRPTTGMSQNEAPSTGFSFSSSIDEN